MQFNLQNGMIDTHFHGLIMENKGLDTKKVLDKAFNTGLGYAVDIGTELDDVEKRLGLLSKFDRILFAAGNYPSEVEKNNINYLVDTLEKIIIKKNTSKNFNTISAIGEIGLDWHWNYGTKKKQMELFEAQIQLANKYKLPVLIHNREADRDILDILKQNSLNISGILHCFSSDYNTAVKLIDMGLFISFAGNVSYKKNSNLRDVASKLPVKSILLETDSPYLSPQQVRGKSNHPGHIGYTYQTVADCQNLPLEDFILNVHNNFLKLFNSFVNPV